MKIIDLTHNFTKTMPAFPGDDPPLLIEERDDDNKIVHYRIETGMHIGTHMDGPLHMVPNGRMLSEIDVSAFIAAGHLIDARKKARLDASLIADIDISPRDCVLFYTGWDERFDSPDFYTSYPVMTEKLAHALTAKKISFIGIDTPSPDRAPYPIHRILLKEEILIIECMNNLSYLLTINRFEVIALPAKFEAEAAPVRVIARIEE